MDIFGLRNRLVQDYSNYIQSFIQIQDARVRKYVDENIENGLLWPDPLIQLNPSFETGEWIDDLVQQEVLHEECARIFRIKENPEEEGKPLRLHQHQSDAVKAAKTANNYVLTTGTGSGKSLAYIVPIVDHVLRLGSGKGIQAIIVYPMNALCNSQHGELKKFLCYGYPKGAEQVRFARYTGQESDEEKQQIIANPPDILLTNYVMLELILTRPFEKNIVDAAQGLRFLVLDELHTYRGRQGADVSLLVRRVRDACDAQDLQCVGTSATLAGPGTYEEQRKEIADVATKLFGDMVKPEMVIGETLKKATPETDLSDPSFLEQLEIRVSDSNLHPPSDYQGFIADPLSIWIENTFGVTTEKESGRLIRTTPKSITGPAGAAKQLSDLIDVSETLCIKAIQEGLLAGYQCSDPDTNFPVFAFRLHQFISRGDNVYASLESPESRYITVYGQQFVPGDRSRILLPIVFCRECGQEYYCVRVHREPDSNQRTFQPRDLSDRYHEEETEPGFFYNNPDKPWPETIEEIIERVPNDWLEEHRGSSRLKKNLRKNLPERIYIGPHGRGSDEGLPFSYVKAPFRFCLNCGVSYGARQVSDIGKLTSLGTEGRSTATTILSLSAIRHLKNEDSLEEKAKKLLSFTDNRQDASLQAGHFNDFVEIGLLRSALLRAAKDADPDGLSHDELSLRVFDALDLPLDLYAARPEAKFRDLEDTKKALRNVIGYRLYHDLRRGWRVTSPNLEQCGLLDIDYPSLRELCEAEDEWQNCHSALLTATPETRASICKVLLDLMRRELAIKVDYLESQFQERIQQQSNQRLIPPWSIDEKEAIVGAAVCYPRPKRRGDYGGDFFLSPRSLFGQYLRRRSTIPNHNEKFGLDATQEIILQLLQIIRVAGLVEEVAPPREKDEVPGYQIPGSAIRWIAGDGTKPFHDPLRVPTESKEGGRTNPFFVSFYQEIAYESKGVEAREHTAQVPYELRVEREDAFREGRLPILYCSPTMELGIDIATLNIVNMRNIPPTPANYAQRSGRAGRSGQPALVFSYCTTGSPHDQYFFKRPERMVAGAVAPPKLELANEDLIQAHVQAVWLTCTRQFLGTSLRDVLDVSGDNPSLELLPSVKDAFQNKKAKAQALESARNVLVSIKEDLQSADWYSEGWVEEVLNKVVLSFEQACERWRSLYRAAAKQRETQHKIVMDASRRQEDRRQAKRLRREAESQLELLLDSRSVMHSDFYSYRYFASEGFLPGYNFPRLPLSAYIPGRFTRKNDFLSRPRFLAISEFGPRSIIYHEGSRYIINKVIMPVGEAESDEEVLTSSVKLCPNCGYLHPISDGSQGLDLCEYCNQQLDQPLRRLFRLQNVSTKRRDRINCDEEERLRLGYEISTGVRFALHGGKPSFKTASLNLPDDRSIATLTYGHAATIWRINLGWARRKNKSQHGFMLDTERGYWARNEQAAEEDEADLMSAKTTRVVPYVEDRRNCLLFQPTNPLDENQMASIQAALKQAIQACYQLEDNELAAEVLPNREERKVILFYESAEGGAGVLRQLIFDPHAFPAVAKEALELCHFDAETGEDRRRAPRATEDCEAACYDCLMTYGNQRDHSLLDRQAIREILLEYAKSSVSASPGELPRAEHLKRLMNQTGSELEKNWLRFLDNQDFSLPSKAQVFLEACKTRPDFFYEDELTVIYVDGPVHEYPERAERDKQQTDCLEDLGYTVVRFGHKDDWGSIISKFPNVFGVRKKG
ncbi:MAG: DEAD/DEAH box helicase [Deltaproteobacteria bacterium]|nr:DEAD/DEAH box helicase [Deltaproteobacteria bacterium]